MKLRRRLASGRAAIVAPYTGAWIEITYYTPAFYTSVSLPYSASYAIDEPLVKYDNWVIDSYIMGGWTSLVTDITYPVRPDRIKIKYDLLDDSTGFYTPIIGNPSVIISEITV